LPADTTFFESRKERHDLYLSGFTHAEAEPDYFPIDDTDVTRQRARTNVFSPGFRCDANGARTAALGSETAVEDTPESRPFRGNMEFCY
jgi:hypothetical protein